MFGLIKKIFMGLLIDIVNASNHIKCGGLFLRKYKKKFQSGLLGNFFREKIWGLRSESASGSYFCNTCHRRCLKVFWICLEFWIYQGSECASSSKYIRVLNMLGFWIYVSRNIRKFRFLKYKNVRFPEV